jgi:hypothetical protein
MNSYRIVMIDEVGTAFGRRDFFCANDEDAIVWAKQLESEDPAEVWSGARFIARIDPKTRAKT